MSIREASARMVQLLSHTPLDADVPTCPDWAVRDLVRHLGGVHRWATTFVATGRRDPISADLEQQVHGWPTDAELLGWFADGSRGLVGALEAAPADLNCWTFLEAETPLLHWARRQAHETAIHRADAEFASGSAVADFPSGLPADGIDELLNAFIARPNRGPRSEIPRSLAVAPDGVESTWTVHFDRTSSTTVVAAPAETDVVVRGPVDAVYRWVWNRAANDEVRLHGDRHVADIWRSTVHVTW